jgi:F-type H+-transporting ATPase subunit delta
MSSRSVKVEAKKLLALSLESGVVSAERVEAVLNSLKKSRPAYSLRPLLRAYLVNVRKEISRGEALIEHAGPLSAGDASNIATHFSKTLSRPITPVARRNDALLAGFRVRVGDDVIDLTAAHRLTNLTKSLS